VELEKTVGPPGELDEYISNKDIKEDERAGRFFYHAGKGSN